MAERNVNSEIDAVKADLSALRSDIEKLVKSSADAASAKGKATYEAAATKGKEGVDALTKQVEDRPLASVGAAFGVGLLLGHLLRR